MKFHRRLRSRAAQGRTACRGAEQGTRIKDQTPSRMTTVGAFGSVSSETENERSPFRSTSNWPRTRPTKSLSGVPSRCTQPFDDLGHAVDGHRDAVVDRHHQHVEPADRGDMAFVELVMQVAEMADAQPRHLENED